MKKFRPDINSSIPLTIEPLDSTKIDPTKGPAGLEVDYDIQYSLGLASNVPVRYINAGLKATTYGSEFLDIFNYLLNQKDPPLVMTMSYGYTEDTWSPDLARYFAARSDIIYGIFTFCP